MLRINGREIPTDSDGFLTDPEDWDMEVAAVIARDEGLTMQEPHWQVVRFVRDYYQSHRRVPEARRVLKHLAERIGKERATRKYLYRLFPYGYGQQACKVAGMRKPMKLWLDL